MRILRLTSLVWACWIIVAASVAAAERPVAPALSLTAEEKAQLLEAVRKMGEQYDSGEHMIRRPFSSPGYHTTLKGGFVHPTRDSLRYAAALLDTGDAELETRAEDILRKVISLQDQDPTSKTYGIWSWFLEEPLPKMSPPDWNWADFCGVQLLQVALYHRSRLPADLARQVDEAIAHAARSIQRRNVGPGYTNIAIMGAYVTLVAAELYNLEDLRAYAMQRLRRFREYTQEQGAFTEYNSPTYTVVALQEIGRLRLHARNAEARKIADDLYQFAWQEIAEHFHPPTRQWAGPHSRCYSTLLPDKTLGLIQHATAGRIRFFPQDPPRSPEDFILPLPCPPEWESFFARLEKPRELVKTFVQGTSPVIGTTWLAPDLTLGSINRGDLWNQRRSLLAYWGTAQKPAYLHLRFLHDGYDFAAAQFRSVQRRDTLVAGVTLATDGGDTHVSLDRIKNSTVNARDLRLRFEFGGAAGEKKPPVPETIERPILASFGSINFGAQIRFARFGSEPVRLESGCDKKTAWIDVVFYSGAKREFRLNELEHAAAAFAIRLAPKGQVMPEVISKVEAGTVELSIPTLDMRLSVPTGPAKVSELQKLRRP